GLYAIEMLTGNHSNLVLTGPRGESTYVYNYNYPSWGSTILDLAVPGTYTLSSLYGNTQPIQFRVVNLSAQATALPGIGAVSEDLASGVDYRYYTVTLSGDEDTWLHGLADASVGNTYRLYDAAGNQLRSGDLSTQTFVNLGHTSGEPATYILAVAQKTGPALRFELQRTPAKAQTLSLNEPVSGRFLGGSQSYEYFLTLDEAVSLKFEDLLNAGSTLSHTLYD